MGCVGLDWGLFTPFSFLVISLVLTQELKSPQQQRIWFVKRVTLCSGEVLFCLILKNFVYLLGKEPVVIFLEGADLIHSAQP